MLDEFISDTNSSKEDVLVYLEVTLKALAFEISTEITDLEKRITRIVFRMQEINKSIRKMESASSKSLEKDENISESDPKSSDHEEKTGKRRRRKQNNDALFDALKVIKE